MFQALRSYSKSRQIAWAMVAFRVVIDPGHGGSDFGAVFQEGAQVYREKDLTLLLSKNIQMELSKAGIPSSLTREDDRDLALPARTQFANRIKADLFLSVHLNSSKGSMVGPAQGVETFILNNTTDASSKRLAELENKGLKVVSSVADSGDSSEVGLILKDLTLDGNLSDSKRLACLIQNEVIRATAASSTQAPQKDRGIKQALFYVLLGAEVPAALIEAGFIDHPKDRALLSTPWGRNIIARGIRDAIVQFRAKKKNRNCRIEGQ